MAGFMAGFGPAFSNAFNAQRERSAEKENMKFKMEFEEAVKRRDERIKTKRDEAKRVELAKSLVSATGQSEAVWPTVYKMLDSGWDTSAVQEHLETYNANVSDAIPDVQGAVDTSAGGDLAAAAENTVTAQMSANGMTGSSDAPDGSAPPDEKRSRGIFGLDLEGNRDKRRQGEIADIMGVSESELKDDPSAETIPGTNQKVSWVKKEADLKDVTINSVAEAKDYLIKAQMSGDPSLIQFAEARLKGQQEVEDASVTQSLLKQGKYNPSDVKAIKTLDGKYVRTVMTHRDEDGLLRDPDNKVIDESQFILTDMSTQTLQERKEIMDKIQPDVDKVSERSKELVNAISLYGQMNGTLDRYGEGVMTASAGLLSKIQSAGRSVLVAKDAILNGRGGDADMKVIEEAMNNGTVEALVKGMFTDQTDQLIVGQAVWEGQVLRTAYSLAKAQSGSGPVTGPDLKNAIAQVTGGGGRAGFNENMRSMLDAADQDIKMSVSAIKNNERANDFLKQYGVPAWAGDVRTIEELVGDSSSPTVKAGWDMYTKQQDIVRSSFNQPPEATQGVEGVQGSQGAPVTEQPAGQSQKAPSQQKIKLLQSSPTPEMIKLFEEAFPGYKANDYLQ